MLIACASDAHRAQIYMESMLEALPAIDALCFLGDMDQDAMSLQYGLQEAQPGAVFHAVAGNGDPFSRLPASQLVFFGKTRALITHGHIFRVKRGLDLLAESALGQGCQLALFGHTHMRCDEWVRGVRLINPGALRDGRYALLRVEAGEISVAFHSVAEI